jgi:hypothetical protein
MEQAREARDREQVEVPVEAAVAGAEEVALRQDRAVIVSAPTAVKERPINWEVLVMRNNVPSAEQL